MGAIAGFFESFLRSWYGGTRTKAYEITSATTTQNFELPRGHCIAAVQTDANYQTGDLTIRAVLGEDSSDLGAATFVPVVDARADLSSGGTTFTITGAVASQHYEISPPLQIGQGQLFFGASQGATDTTVYIRHRPYY